MTVRESYIYHIVRSSTVFASSSSSSSSSSRGRAPRDAGVHLARLNRRVESRQRLPRVRLRVVPYKAMAGWSSKASGGVERRRGRGLKPSGGRRDAPAKVLKDRRSHRQRGRMGTSVTRTHLNLPRGRPRCRVSPQARGDETDERVASTAR
eukprot:31455-Pelagococcus_subviridis.AAC.3